MEEYYTIQGEGYNTGRAAHFFRLAGCNVGCHWCDVKDSWDAAGYPLLSSEEIVGIAAKAHAQTAVITGGEPLMYNLNELCNTFHAHGIKVFIETSGAYSFSGNWDWICVSPKKFKAPLDELLEKANELKVIVYNQSDFEWGLKYAEKVGQDCHLFFQPEWSKFKTVMPLIVAFVKENPRWRISLQTHKFMDIP